MFKRILVPVGGTPVSEDILPYALVVAKALGIPITLMTVVQPDDTAEEPASVSRARAEGGSPTFVAETVPRIGENLSSNRATVSARAELRRIADKLSEEGVETAVRVEVGDPVSEILRASDEDNYNLIAIATRGRNWFGRVLYGSVADEVIRSSTIPVFTMGPETSELTPETGPILSTTTVLLDGSKTAERAIPYAKAFAKALRLKVKLLRIIDTGGPYPGLLNETTFIAVLPEISAEATSYLNEVAEALRADGLHVETELLAGSPREIVAEQARNSRGAIVALATRGLSGLTRVWTGSVAETAVRLSVGPVLVVPPAASE